MPYLWFDLILIGGLAAGSLYYGIFHFIKRKRLLRQGETVSAHVVGQGSNQDGSYQILAFTVNGNEHRLPYPMPRKNKLPEGDLTLHYDPYRPENLLVEEDKTDLYGSIFCIALGIVLSIITVGMVL